MWLVALLVASAALLAGSALAASLRRERRHRRVHAEAAAAGLSEPASLHPVIDPASCIGCGACVEACPEGDILGMIDGKARLIEPTACIGHGACREACPTHSITLVFGTETRGVDIPFLRPTFETNVPGIYIAGELGGMGLIGNAIEQGCQAVASIAALEGIGSGDGLDLLIAGAGPAGLAASLASRERGLRFATIEQDVLGGTVAHYPRRKLVMTRPVQLPLVGKVPFRETTRETLLEFWTDVERRTGLGVRYGERLEHVQRESGHLRAVSSRGSYRARAVLLAIGRRGTPRKLDVPGEEHPKVVYRMIEPGQYRDSRVLVVGGGDSALEAALAVAEEGATVSLSYRGEAFTRAKPRNRERLERARGEGSLSVLLGSVVRRIRATEVELEHDRRDLRLLNDFVIVCAGGVLPTPFLRRLGVDVATKFGTA